MIHVSIDEINFEAHVLQKEPSVSAFMAVEDFGCRSRFTSQVCLPYNDSKLIVATNTAEQGSDDQRSHLTSHSGAFQLGVRDAGTLSTRLLTITPEAS